ncbi:MAG: monovalent cation/H+ antiporter complex subunit F [Halolamina sp.]|uniref:monovalent cation/H+ antiporter complex subunit F n=1 Tax=Halolamina sp. TaxID=1940283 RepID=UPI002FC33B99
MSEATGLLAMVLEGGLLLAALVTLAASYRVIIGPTVPDRVVALDVIATNVVAIALLYSMYTDSGFYVDVAVVLAIIGFISTIAVSRFITEGDIIR